MQKLTKQIAALLGLAAVFIGFDCAVYQLVTKRYQHPAGTEMQTKSIEVSRFLPFDDAAEIVRAESDLTLSGEIPVIDGAAALFPVYAAFVHAVYPPESVAYDENGDFLPQSAMQYTNTRGAYKAVADGTADVVICAAPSEEQLAYAQAQGTELEMTPIGYDAFVFIVNKSNPVDDLTTEQIRSIYSGAYTNWQQLGGENLPIDALQRNAGSGSQSAMEAFMDGTEMHRNPLGFLGGAVGYSFRYYVADIVQDGNVKMLSLDGVYPDAAHIADGSYPLVTPFYAVYGKHNPNPAVPVLIDWICSAEGQKIVAESGYIPYDG